MCPARSKPFPDPDDHPTADVVIFDATCGLCRNSVSWLKGFDRGGRLAFLPLDDPRVARRYPDLSATDLEKHLHVIDVGGRRHKGADAARYLSRRIPALWPLAPLLRVPGSMPIWRWLYQQVSKRRHLFDAPE